MEAGSRTGSSVAPRLHVQFRFFALRAPRRKTSFFPEDFTRFALSHLCRQICRVKIFMWL
jgi:hypothetical protein